jgi:hypothetical protein
MFEGDEHGSGSGRHMPLLYMFVLLAGHRGPVIEVLDFVSLTREIPRGAVCLSCLLR